jgi:hypothetical protein
MSACRILYLNAHGLNEQKHDYIISLLESDAIDIAAISETWHPTFLPFKHNSFHAASSSTTRHSRTRGHPDGGVSVFIRPSEHHHYTFHSSLDAVSMSKGEHTMTFAYFPPSLSKDDLELLRKGLPKSTLIAADFNVDFRTPSTRRSMFLDHMKKSSLVQIVPSNGVSRLDHCFAHPCLPISCEMHHQYRLEIDTDHPALVVQCTLPDVTSPAADSHSYNLSLLKRSCSREGTKRYLLQLYRRRSADISRELHWLSLQANASMLKHLMMFV